MAYCTITGRSKPYSLRRASCRTGSMPRSPASVSIGSPGTSRISTKARKVIPMKVGITRLNLVKTNLSIGDPPPEPSASPLDRDGAFLLQVDAIERVAAERAQLEVHDLLAHRLDLHGMGDREPGRL